MDRQARIRHKLKMRDLKGPIYQNYRSFVNVQKSLDANDLQYNSELYSKLTKELEKFDSLTTEAIKNFLDNGGTVDDIG